MGKYDSGGYCMSDEFFKGRDKNLLNDYFVDYKNSKSDIFISNASKFEKERRQKIKEEMNFNQNDDIKIQALHHDFKNNNAGANEFKAIKSNIKLKNTKKKKPKVKLALLILFISVLGIIFFTNNIDVKHIDAININKTENFQDLIETLVMQDPLAFDDICKADIDTITKASIWECILSQEENHYKNFDSRGFTIIPSEDIINTAKKLFGSNYQLELRPPQENTFYELSEDKNNFYVKPISNHNNYLPLIEESVNNGDSITLKVAYIPGNDPYRIRPQGEVEKPTTEKYMYYTLKKDDKTGDYYIYSVKETS